MTARFFSLLLLMGLVTTVHAQSGSGLISGVVVDVVDDDDNPRTDVPVVINGEDKGTDDDGSLTIPIAQFEPDTPIRIWVEYSVPEDGDITDQTLFIGDEDDDGCEDDEGEAEEEEDDACVLLGTYPWGRDPSWHIRLGDDPTRFRVDLPRGGRTPIRTGDPESPADPSLFVTHGYNLEFKDGFFGVRGRYPIPLGDHPLTLDGGFDYYAQDDFSSTFAVQLDVTYNWNWPALGDATANVGAGGRLFRQTFDSPGSSSDNEFGPAIISGMTYPLGPVELYGDVEVARLYDAWVPSTRIGAGLRF